MSTLRVYFNQPVYGTLNSFARIKATINSVTSIITLSNKAAIDSSNQVYDFKIDTPLTSNMTSLALEVVSDPSPTVISDDSRAVGFVGYVTVKNELTGVAGIAQTRAFSNNTAAGADLTNIAVIATDNKTIRVFYPTQMNHDGIAGDYLTSVLNPNNYRFVNGESTPIDLIDTSGIAQIKYNSDEHSVTITLNRTIPSSLNNLIYLLFANTNVRNEAGTQFVRNGSAPIKIPFPLNSTASAEVTVTNATYTNGVITVELSQLAKSWSNLSNTSNGDQLASVFNTLIITLTPVTQAALASGQTGKININQASLTGINGNPTDINSNVIFELD
jgi:hypothetical protein